MHSPGFSSIVRYATLVLVLTLSAGVDGASLKVCKRICGLSVQTDCVGLRKGKLKKCRNRIWKACKRGKTDCAVVTSTTATTSTTVAIAATTSSTTLATTTTTALPTTTTTTLPPDDIVFAGKWVVHPTIISDTCNPGNADNVLDVHGSAAQATATLEFPGLLLTGQVDDSGNLLLSVEIMDEPGCVTEVAFRLLGPLELSDPTTTGDASLTRRGDCVQQCQTLYTCSFDRSPPS